MSGKANIEEAIVLDTRVNFDQLEIGKLYKVERGFLLTPQEIEAVKRRLITRGDYEKPEEAPTNDEVNAFTDWTWKDGKGQKLPVRLKRFFYKEYGKKLPPLVLEEVGNVLKRVTEWGSDIVYLSIVDNFDWKAGDFGDGRSCFWQSRYFAKLAIKHNGGGALTLYNAEGEGIARAWMGRLKDGSPVFFNAYGAALETLVSLLGSLTTQKMSMVEADSAGSDVYLNSGTIYALTNDGKRHSWKLYWMAPSKCQSCKEVYETNEKDGGEGTPHDKEGFTIGLCPKCAVNFFKCPHCRQASERDKLKKWSPKEAIYGTPLYQCPHCYEVVGVGCTICGKMVEETEIVANEAKKIVRHKTCKE